MMDQLGVIFGVFMVFFYLGVGIYLIFFFNYTTMDKALRVILGSSFLFYGVYRAFRTYTKISELFFSHENKDERGKFL